MENAKHRRRTQELAWLDTLYEPATVENISGWDFQDLLKLGKKIIFLSLHCVWCSVSFENV